MARTTLWVVSVFLFTSAFSQTPDSNTLYWNSGTLRWSDFMGLPVASSPFDSELCYFLGFSTKKFKAGDTTVEGLVSYCFMDKSISWVSPETRTPAHLAYNQAIFDIAELYSRRMQQDINRNGGTLQGAEDALRTAGSQCRSRLNQFAEATNYGRDSVAVRQWHEQVKNELNQTPREMVPDYSERKLGLGYAFGLGFGTLTGSMGEYFSNNINLGFGLEVAYGKPVLFLGGCFGGNRVRKEYEKHNKVWEKDLRTVTTLLEAGLRYPVIQDSRYDVSLFGGAGAIEFTVSGKKAEFEDHRLVGMSGVIGIGHDWKFSKSLSLVDWMEGKSHWAIRSRLYVAFASLDQRISGTSINLSVGIGQFMRFVRTD